MASLLHAQEILNLKKRLNEIYVKHTGQPLKKIEDALERDYFYCATPIADGYFSTSTTYRRIVF
jgi:ATP-dependent Clp protease protease subunit